jgi:hypothetical protein
LVKFGVAEESFGRDAAPVEAGAAGAFHFDAGDAFAELGGTDGADISGGSTADHDEIVRHRPNILGDFRAGLKKIKMAGGRGLNRSEVEIAEGKLEFER